jgi:hypothetical protein
MCHLTHVRGFFIEWLLPAGYDLVRGIRLAPG